MRNFNGLLIIAIMDIQRNDIRMILGHNLAVLRNKAKLTQEQLGLAIGSSASYIAQMEKGRGFGIDTLVKLCEKLNVDPGEFYKLIGNSEPKSITSGSNDLIANSEQEDVDGVKQKIQHSTAIGKYLLNFDKIKDENENFTIKTGFPLLDTITGGLQGGNLVVLTGGTSMGKTSFALSLAIHAIKSSKTVFFYSMEMKHEMLIIKLLSMYSETDHLKLSRGLLSKNEFKKATNYAHDLSKMAFCSQNTISLEDLKDLAEQIDAESKPDLIIIDYLQLVTDEAGELDDSRNADLPIILKNLASQLNIPIIGILQLSIDENVSGFYLPKLSDIRKGNDLGCKLEQYADLVLFIHREDCYSDLEQSNISPTTLYVLKNRNGPVGKSSLSFYKNITLFKENEY